MPSLIEENRWIRTPKTEPIPIDLSAVIDPMQDFLELINSILNVTLEILEFVEAFITSLLDPMLALLQTIIRLLKGILTDLDQLGIYVATDFGLVATQNYDLLKGGYVGFQNRMIERWLMPDAMKPDFKASGAIAIYLYASTNFIEGIDPIVKVLKLILGLFNLDKKVPMKELPSIGEVEVLVRNQESLLTKYNITEKEVELSFPLHLAPRGSAISPNIGGFLVEMSSFENGLLMGYSENVLPVKNQAGTNKQKKKQGLYRSGKQTTNARWFSGTIEDSETNSTNNKASLKQRQNFFLRNPMDVVRIKPSDVVDAGKHVFMKTFGLALSQKTHTITIPFSELPKGYNILPDGTVEETDLKKVYFRVTAIKKSDAKFIQQTANMGLSTELYNFPLNLVKGEIEETANTIFLQPYDYEAPFSPAYSSTAKANGLSSQEELLIETLEAALTCAFLTDFLQYIPNDGVELNNYADTGQYISNLFFGVESDIDQEAHSAYQREYERRSSLEYRKTVKAKIKSLARKLSQDFPAGLLSQVDKYSSVRSNSQIEVFDDESENSGLFINYKQPYWKSTEEEILDAARSDHKKTKTSSEKRIFAVLLDRKTNEPIHPVKASWHATAYASTEVDLNIASSERFNNLDWAALVLYYGGTKTNVGNGESVFVAVRDSYEFLSFCKQDMNNSVLGFWSNVRFLENGIPPLEEFLLQSIKFFEDLEEGLKGFGEKIKKAIAQIEDKILQIQEIIALIDRVLEALKNMEITFDFPCDMLIHVGSGNGELLNQLVSSSDQPPDGSQSYSIGMVLVAGGVPTVLLDLLGQLFTGGK